jgi:hypothetical protein
MRQARQDELDEVIRTVSQAFLGLTIGCARCHAHKFDPITQQDYYSMQAIFAGLRYGDRRMRGAENDRWSAQAPQAAKQISELDAELQLARKTLGLRRPIANIQHEPFAPMLAKTIRMEIRASNNSQPASIYEIEVWTDAAEPINVALAESGTKVSASGFALENQSRHPDNLIDGTVDPRQAYPWKADKAGPAWIQIDLPRAQNIAKIVWQKGYSAPADYKIKIQLPDQTWKTVAHSADRMPRADDTRQAKDVSLVTQNGDPIPQKETAELVALMTRLRAARSEHARLIAGPQVYGASFGKPDEIWLLRRGDAMQRAKKVGPAIPESLGDLSLSQDLPESKRRAALATFLGSTSNPLVARVIVNRIWQHVFGNGIVETPSDFGRMGSQPSHPLLLDWLAVEFVQNGWSLKHIHRLILNSNTFRQSSRPHAASLATDAESRLLWRFPPRRLDAESLRDSILQVSGKLNPKMGGPGFDFFNQKGGLSDYIAKETFDANGWRRMIYSTRIRMQAVDIFGAFDCPDSGQMRPNRPRSITPIQALSMLNSPFVNRQANFMAERVLTVAGNQLDHQVSLAVELVFSRRPTEEEKSMLSELARVHGMGQVCRVLINSNEFLFLR